MNNIQHAQQGRIDKTLNKVFRFQEGVMSRKQWILLMIEKGYKAEPSTKHKAKYNRRKYNNMDWADQIEYEKKCNEIVPCFIFRSPEGPFYDITKIEYDFIQSL